MRLHRSVANRVRKIDVNQVANAAEDYILSYTSYKSYLKDARGLVNVVRMRTAIKKIDQLEREMIKLEEKIERVAERRAAEAVKLEDHLNENLDIVREVLEPEEYRDFWR